MNTGKILQVDITEEVSTSYLDYAMSVIVSRALPDVRDGLKPVHRRILFAMKEMGLSSSAKFQKCAKVVGEVMGKFHPHGDAPVYEALVRLAQDFSMRYPLVEGQGNFGSVDGDPPAAMRYTESRLAAITEEILRDIEKDTVDFVPNFDNTLKEPAFLPAKLPNLLLMGAEGIAVGMATKIPPHNLTEIIDGLNHLIDNPEADVTALMQFIKGPDFPTGGAIYNLREIQLAYSTGKGKIVMRAKAEIEDIGQGKNAIIVNELPYQVNKAGLVERIAELVKDKKLEGISDLRDESDRRGMRIYIELKRDARPKQVLNNLFKHTSMQTTFPVNIVALIDGTPRTLTLKEILEEYLKHRVKVVTRRSEFELREARAREHILLGLKIALDHLDAVIKTIRESPDADTAKKNLMARFNLTEIQATAILDMQLRRLAALERQKIEDELSMIQETIIYLEDLLAHPVKILAVIKDELSKLKEKYGDERRTKVYKGGVGEFSEEDLIPNVPTVITLTKTGYIKRLSQLSFKTQNRGGKGVIGMTTKEEDEISHTLAASTHDNILLFTDKGKVYQLKAWDVSESGRAAKGTAIVNLINIEQNENVTSLLAYSDKLGQPDKSSQFVLMATKKGTVKKTPLAQYANIRKNGLVAIKLESGDELRWVKPSGEDDEVLLVTLLGKSIKFPAKQVRATNRDTIGVRGIALKKDDCVVGMDVLHPEDYKSNRNVLVILAHGIGKRTAIKEFPRQNRGGQGVKIATITTKTGHVVNAQIIDTDNCEAILLTSAKGQVVKLPLGSAPRLSRSAQGVILMRFADKADSLAAASCLNKD